MVKTACPPREALWQLLQRQLPAEQARNLERHLRDCPPCAQAYQMLKEDSLPDAVTLAPVDSGSLPVARPAMSVTTPQTFTFLAPAQQPDELGRLGPYRILKVLGQGGMGVVFRAEDSRLQRSVALKVMLPDQAQRPEAKERFLREARAAAALEHDNIVAIYQVDEDCGVAYIAMPFLKGMSLDGWLKQKQQDGRGTPLKLSQVCKIGREIARGLAAAHARGLVHRDIKPANIWLDATAGGRVKILDFGLARATSGEQHLTQSGVIVGTPAYMAPEQAQGKPVDARADLFSLGVVLYRMCTGTSPFAGADLVSTLVAVATTEPPAPRSINPELPPALSDLVMKLLAKDPGQRVASAADVVKAIQAIEKELQAGSGRMPAETFPIEPIASQTVPLPTARPSRKPAAATGRAAPGKRRGKTRKSRGRLVAAGVLILLISLGAFLGRTFLWHAGSPPAAVAPFDAAAAKRHQGTWAKHLKMSVVTTNSLGMKLVLIPPGEFLMGFTAAEVEDVVGKTKVRTSKKHSQEVAQDRIRGASPQHRVTLTRPYLLGMTEVTVGQFGKFVKHTGYRTEAERSGQGAVIYDPVVKRFYADPKANWHNLGFPQTNDHPVGAVSWDDAVAFCEWLSRKEGRTYRLPTEAEWEFAGRAGTATLTPYGPGVTEQEAVFNRDKGGWPEPVGARAANAFGLHDMIGNVWEWCADWYRPYPPGDQTDPMGPADGDRRVLRGFCFSSDWIVGTAYRHHRNQDAVYMAFGFRVVCEVAPPPPSGFVSLFNGKDLTGWKTHPSQPGGWTVEDGLLVGRSARANHLFSARGDYENFHLRAEARINKYGNSGIYFRSDGAPNRGGKYPTGYEAQILHSYPKPNMGLTGSLFGVAPVVKPLVEPDQWFTLEVVANGNRLVVKINGEVTADFVDTANTYRKGHLALQAMSDAITNVTTVVQFRTIEIKDFPSAVAVLVPLDLLALIDPAKDRVDGNWQRNLAGELVSDQTLGARVQIPYRPPAEYNLHVAFTRTGGNADVNQYLVGAGRQVMFMLGGWDNTLGGLDMVDGKRIDDNRTGIRQGASLQNGRRYATLTQVRKNGVKVFLDGVPLLEFRTTFANVGLDPNWLLRDPTLLALGSYGSPTVFHRVEVVELSGPGTFLRPNDPAAKRARAPR